jgi:hypothetical protein
MSQPTTPSVFIDWPDNQVVVDTSMTNSPVPPPFVENGFPPGWHDINSRPSPPTGILFTPPYAARLASVVVNGNGFTGNETITIGGISAVTTVISPTSFSFIVPDTAPYGTNPAIVANEYGSWVGSFIVLDPAYSIVTVQGLSSGQSQSNIRIDNGIVVIGTRLDLITDIKFEDWGPDGSTPSSTGIIVPTPVDTIAFTTPYLGDANKLFISQSELERIYDNDDTFMEHIWYKLRISHGTTNTENMAFSFRLMLLAVQGAGGQSVTGSWITTTNSFVEVDPDGSGNVAILGAVGNYEDAVTISVLKDGAQVASGIPVDSWQIMGPYLAIVFTPNTIPFTVYPSPSYTIKIASSFESIETVGSGFYLMPQLAITNIGSVGFGSIVGGFVTMSNGETLYAFNSIARLGIAQATQLDIINIDGSVHAANVPFTINTSTPHQPHIEAAINSINAINPLVSTYNYRIRITGDSSPSSVTTPDTFGFGYL